MFFLLFLDTFWGIFGDLRIKKAAPLPKKQEGDNKNRGTTSVRSYLAKRNLTQHGDAVLA